MAFIQLQFRRDTAANWTLHNPTLASGELGIETDTSLFKIGNGSQAWNALAYGGLQGPQGIQGIQGPAGSTGPAGADGADGADGKTVLSGAVDPTTEGVDGDFYINTTSWEIFGPKTAGVWGTGSSLIGPQGDTGATGPAGADGAAGADGRTVLSGAVDPTTEGVDGDFYINTTSWEIFGPKTGGNWATGTDLIGATGAQGPAGADGADGKTVLSGSVDPTTEGVDGDFYINTTSWEIFGPKTGGSWGTGVPVSGSFVQKTGDTMTGALKVNNTGALGSDSYAIYSEGPGYSAANMSYGGIGISNTDVLGTLTRVQSFYDMYADGANVGGGIYVRNDTGPVGELGVWNYGGPINFYANDSAQPTLKLVGTVNDVNGVSLTAATTENTPAITAIGTDTDIGLLLQPKGIGTLQLGVPTTYVQNGKLVTTASDATQAGLKLPHGAAPASPENGDIWTTTAGIYAQVNGSTVGPLGTGGGGGTPGGSDTQVQFNNAGSFGGDDDFTWNSTTRTLTLGAVGGLATIAMPNDLTFNGDTLYIDQSDSRVGINTSTPEATLTVVSQGTSNTRGILLQHVDNTTAFSHAKYIGRRSRGSHGSPSAVQADDSLAGYIAAGYKATGWSNTVGGLYVYAAENWTDTATGTYVTIRGPKPGGTTVSERVRFEHGKTTFSADEYDTEWNGWEGNIILGTGATQDYSDWYIKGGDVVIGDGINVNLIGGQGGATGTGGSVGITGGSSSVANGGAVSITGGQSSASGSTSGSAWLRGGFGTSGANGGSVQVGGGHATSTGNGGSLLIFAGGPVAGGTGNGGNVSIYAGIGGEGATGGTAGTVQIEGGNSQNTTTPTKGGNVVMRAGSALQLGDGGDAYLIGGAAGGTDRAGGKIVVKAGNATGTGVGGDAEVIAGISPSGTHGQVLLRTSPDTNTVTGFAVEHTASGVNYIAAKSSASTTPSLEARGTGTNVDIVLTPKGAGAVSLNGSSVSLPVASTRIRGDFSVSTIAQRVAFQSSTTDGNTSVQVIPNGTALQSQALMLNNSSAADCGFLAVGVNSVSAYISSSRIGTGTSLPLELKAGDIPVLGVTVASTGVTLHGTVGCSGTFGYNVGVGGAVTQDTSRTNGVTLNTICGAITLLTATGSASWQSFTVTNSTVAATDTIIVNQKSGTDKYMIHVTNVAAGSFELTYATTGGTTAEAPVFNFSVIKAAAS